MAITTEGSTTTLTPMAIITDGSTITGSDTSTLATIFAQTIAEMQNYSSTAKLMHVSEPYRGGVFYYYSEAVGGKFIDKAQCILSGATIKLTKAVASNKFAVNQVIYLTDITANKYLGAYTIRAFDGQTFTLSPSFITELPHAGVTIQYSPLQYDLIFGKDGDPNKIFNSNYAAFPASGFLANGFDKNQTITVTGTSGYNATYTIYDIAEDTITVLGTGPFTTLEEAYAIIKNADTVDSYVSDKLTFNADGNSPTIIDDSTAGLITNGFKPNQTIIINHSTNNNITCKVLSVSTSSGTSKLTIASAFPVQDPLAPVTSTLLITTCDGGIKFPALGKSEGGSWERQYDPKGGISVSWFGGKPVSSFDATEAIQRTIDYAALNDNSMPAVFIPKGNYMVSQLVIPQGLNMYGEGNKQSGGGTSLTLLQTAKLDLSMLVFNPFGASNSLLYWNGKINDMAFHGFQTTKRDNSTGFGICLRTPLGLRVAIDDTTIFDNLTVRDFPSGGIELPLGGAPGYILNSKMERNGGPGIAIKKPFVTKAEVQSVSFINISGDGNYGGLFAIGGYDSSNTFVFINLKGENSRQNVYHAGVICQQNMIVVDGNCTAMLSINGACNQPVVKDLTQTTKLIRIGDLVLANGGSKPRLFWNGVNFRYNSSQIAEPGNHSSSADVPKVISDPVIEDDKTVKTIGTNQSSGVYNAGFTMYTANSASAVADYYADAITQLVSLPVISADKSIVLPRPQDSRGGQINIWNRNTSTGNHWLFKTQPDTGTTPDASKVYDAAEQNIAQLVNAKVYQLQSDGEKWLIIN